MDLIGQIIKCYPDIISISKTHWWLRKSLFAVSGHIVMWGYTKKWIEWILSPKLVLSLQITSAKAIFSAIIQTPQQFDRFKMELLYIYSRGPFSKFRSLGNNFQLKISYLTISGNDKSFKNKTIIWKFCYIRKVPLSII